MRILIATPVPSGSQRGNRITAHRWAQLLRESGHEVEIVTDVDDHDADLLIALHAVHSADSILRFRERQPGGAIALLLTGTDLESEDALRREQSLAHADAIAVLQEKALDKIDPRFRADSMIVYQSSKPLRPAPERVRDPFEVCILAHLRPIKDPLRLAYAVRDLPTSSRIHAYGAGEDLDRELAQRAREESVTNPRYTWLGALGHDDALRRIASSQILVNSSFSEGGANVVSEAIVAGTLVLATRMDGNIGLLGDDYPGYFAVESTRELTALLLRTEQDESFRRELQEAGRNLAERFHPTTERQALEQLVQRTVARSRSPH